MSLIREIRPLCDLCGYLNPDIMSSCTGRVRRLMALNGWRKRNRKDFCPDCVAKTDARYS